MEYEEEVKETSNSQHDNGKPGAGIDTFELYIDVLLYSGGTLIKGDIRLKD